MCKRQLQWFNRCNTIVEDSAFICHAFYLFLNLGAGGGGADVVAHVKIGPNAVRVPVVEPMKTGYRDSPNDPVGHQ